MSLSYWVDSHCHLHYEGLFQNIDAILKECKDHKIGLLLCVSTDTEDFKKISSFIDNDIVYQSIGIHPLNAHKYTDDQIREYLDGLYPKVIAIGETGLDNFRAPLNPEQISSFRIHIEHALKYDLPIIMHNRGNDTLVEQEAMKLISEYKVKGVAHCFGGSFQFAEFLINHGWYISFAGNLTYKNATNLQQVAAEVPIDRILIETDSPFLAPHTHRGSINRPIRVIEVAEKLATLKNMSLDDVQANTWHNFTKLFRILN